MVTGADVGVLVRGSVVAVQVEQTVVRVLVVVAADVQNNARGVVVAIVGLEPEHSPDYWCDGPDSSSRVNRKALVEL